MERFGEAYVCRQKFLGVAVSVYELQPALSNEWVPLPL